MVGDNLSKWSHIAINVTLLGFLLIFLSYLMGGLLGTLSIFVLVIDFLLSAAGLLLMEIL